jgi:hypothetical protein
MDMQEARARVQQGVLLLDKNRPGWAERIDLDVLCLSSNCTCILGQLEGSFIKACMLLLGGSYNVAESHGFWLSRIPDIATDHDAMGKAYQPLHDAWTETITERLTPPATWTHRDPVAATGVERCERPEAVRP